MSIKKLGALIMALTASLSTQATIVEIVHLQIADGVSYEQFAPVDNAVAEQHVAKQKGFISRESMRGENGEWSVVVHWQSVADADASMASFANAPASAQFMQMIKPETMQMKRYTVENKQ